MLFCFDSLALLMLGLVVTMAVIVIPYSIRYLRAEPLKHRFVANLAILFILLGLFYINDHILMAPLIFFGIAVVFARLVHHNTQWSAAKASYHSIIKTLGLVWLGLLISCFGLYWGTQEVSILQITQSVPTTTVSLFLALSILSLAILAALWPFHRWLVATLNAPTPVSACLHAGLINAAGFWLARWAPMLSELPWLLNLILMMGFASFMMGWVLKQVAPGFKGYLVYSTVSQMGFMFIQGGFMLYPFMVGHIIFHALFKATCFLNQSNCINMTTDNNTTNSSYGQKVIAFILAIIGTVIFSVCAGLPLWSFTNILLVQTVVLITLSQILLNGDIFKISKLFFYGLSVTLIPLVYGCLMRGIDMFLPGSIIDHLQPLNSVQSGVIFSLLAMWWLMHINLSQLPVARLVTKKFMVFCVNHALPLKVLTPHRTRYQHKVLS